VDFQSVLVEYRDLVYPIIFIWAFLEGETFVIFAGIAAHQGYLSWWGLFLSAWFGSFAGDQCYFWIGRRYGDRLLLKFPRWEPPVRTALSMLERYNTWFILSFRFIYGVRNVASFAMGASGVHWVRFFFLNLLAACLWALSFSGAGYLFGEAFEAVLGDMVQAFGLVMLGVFAFLVLLVGYFHRRHMRARFMAKAVPQANGDR
jgi:membrane protein DedA with SNARE-associated domain